ncbi:TPA: IS6 family transposase [Bacillus thuringiensis]|nr:IS6 family transposase [Bacillus thuringiensis]
MCSVWERINSLYGSISAKPFFKTSIALSYVSTPRVITVDKGLVYPVAIEKLKNKMPKSILFKKVKSLNNIVRQDHYHIKEFYILC